MADITKKPFNLDSAAVAWVRDTLAGMTDDEKIGQLFVDMAVSEISDDAIAARVAKACPGGIRYMNRTPQQTREQNRLYQKYSKIPVLIASNIEGGGSGGVKGGTHVGNEAKIAATRNVDYAYKMGLIGARETKALGCNWSFSPIADVCMNWRNPIISTRTWGDDPELVREYSLANLRGLRDGGIAAAAKHFPGDGVDERDHHLSSSVNTLSVEEWDATFGRIYKALIDDGLHSIMAGHIMLPAYQKFFNPDMKPDELMPATLCRELLTDLLRGRLGFNGLIVTDATHMVAFSGRMPRKLGLPAAIMAGCDMILWYQDTDDDFVYLREALDKGLLTRERLDEAVTRILALKASLGLHLCAGVPDEEGLSVVGCQEHQKVADEVADRAITLAKQVGAPLLPLDPVKQHRLLLVPIHDRPGDATRIAHGVENIDAITASLAQKLTARGFEVSVYRSPLEDVKPGTMFNMADFKISIERFKETCDAVLTLANVGSFSVTQRLLWNAVSGGVEAPWYVYEVPEAFISFACPFHLADVPQVKNYINCYDAKEHTLEALADKLTGKSEFKGISPVDVFCGLPDTRL